MNRKLLLAVMTMGLVNFGLLTTPFLHNNWDSEMHLFFASHYAQNWFQPWEPKWYGGFYVYVSAPLVHQLMALVGILSGLENAYLIVQWISLVCLPLVMYLLVREVVDEETAGWAALLVTGASGIYVVTYTFGQLPTLVAMDLGLLACTLYTRFLKNGSMLAFVSWMYVIGASVATHHYTIITVVPIIVICITIKTWLTQRFSWESILRPLAGGIAFGIMAVVAIAPFWWWYLTQNLPQVEIFHPTRGHFLADPIAAKMFFWDMYGGILYLAPLGLLALYKRRGLLPMVGLVAILAVFGLGGETPIPKLILGSLWSTLTYDRFAFWAAILAVIPIAVFMVSLKGRLLLIVESIALIVCLIGLQKAISFPYSQQLLQKPLLNWEEVEIVKFLDEHDQWNYFTLGMGEPEMARLSRLSSARSIDGYYNQARTNELQRDSGIGTVDASEWVGEQSYPLLFNILQHPAEWNVRWCVSDDPWSEGHLRNSGWSLLHPIGSSIGYQIGDQYYSTVTVWEAPAEQVAKMKTVAELDSERNAAHRPSMVEMILSYWWGLVPLCLLVLGMINAIWEYKKEVSVFLKN